MKIKPYINKLNNSKEYKEFQKKYKDSFMIAGFFILDLETQNNLHQIDYYIPSEKKIAAFTVDKGVVMEMLNMINNKLVPEKLDIQTNIDLDALPGILEDEMKNRSITEEIKKIIAIIQTIEGKKIWNLSCVLSGMGVLKAHIDDNSKTVLKMEKSSILDYVKKLPAGALKGIRGIPGAPNKEVTTENEEAEETEEIPIKETDKSSGISDNKDIKEAEKELKEKIDNLKKLEQEIEKEQEKYKKETTKKESKKK